MKRIYLARHGQTFCNANHTFQDGNDELNDTGKMQAIRLAERAGNLSFEKIICSDFLRTQQTAEPLVEATKVPLELSALFREEKRPSSWVGQSMHTAEAKEFYHELIQRAGETNYRVEDAENAFDVLARAKKALKLLEADPAENIFVITHGDFLKMFIANIMLGGEADVVDVVRIRYTLKTINTGISVVIHDGSRWRVLTWNDHAHFAE